MKHQIIIILLVVLTISCKERVWNNPFDPDCPKEIYTPSGFLAIQKGNFVTLTWSQEYKLISGFIIEKKVDNGTWQEVAILDKSISTWNDEQITFDKLHIYRIYAFAGKNQSNQINTEITPILLSWHIPINGLVAWYPFNGNANDESGNGFNGIVNGATLTTDRLGYSNSAYSFDGINDDINLGINTAINNILNDFTVSYWIYKTTLNNGTVIASYSSQGGSSWRMNSALLGDSIITGFLVLVTGIYGGQWQSNLCPKNTIQLNTWMNITIIRNGTLFKTYVNSKLVSSSTVSSSSIHNPISPPATTKIGVKFPNIPNDSEWFQGKIDDVCIYDRALNEQEIKTLYIANSLTDIDGNVYKTVQIGTQTWMVENLKITKYRDGSAIPNVTDKNAWASLTTGAYCWYDNFTENKATYGALYNWYAVNTGNLCPTGWHVPTDTEWTTLCNYLGGESVAGGKMKETGTAHWLSPNTGATNSSNFSGLPGGCRYSNAIYNGAGVSGDWWSTTETSSSYAWDHNLVYNGTNLGRNYYSKADGFSIRCLKD